MHERVAIVGAGVNGLSCGIRLLERGIAATIFAERVSPNTTSDRSGAVFTPFRIEGHPQAARWTEVSHRAFRELVEHHGSESGVSLTPFREFFFAPQNARPWWAEFVEGYRRIVDPPAPYAEAVAAIVPKMDITRYMPWLVRRFETLRGQIVRTRVENLADLFDRGYQIVVNCSGLGARALAHDEAVVPMRGQVLHLRNDWSLPECLVEEGRGETTTYVFPFENHVVLGGTYERGEWSDQTDEPSLVAIMERASALLRAAGHADVDLRSGHRLRAVAGLRPARLIGGCEEAVRLEREELAPGRTIIHNYGHGRAGVTLSWGCAEEVSRLVLLAEESFRE